MYMSMCDRGAGSSTSSSSPISVTRSPDCSRYHARGYPSFTCCGETSTALWYIGAPARWMSTMTELCGFELPDAGTCVANPSCGKTTKQFHPATLGLAPSAPKKPLVSTIQSDKSPLGAKVPPGSSVPQSDSHQ